MSLNPQFTIAVRELLKSPQRNFTLTERNSILSPTKVFSELSEMGFKLSKRWVKLQHPRTGRTHKVIEYSLIRDWSELNAKGRAVLKSARRAA